MADAPTSYDTVSYLSFPFQQTHPARIAAIARLHGVPAASPRTCRVLELGVGDGSNLIPMAVTYPDAEFVGVDLAPTAVAKGQAVIDALGLKNVRLIAADLRVVDESFGQFDFITGHGLFSWVPDEVRLAILDLCRRSLAPAGVVYMSYNALPGCHVRRVFWDILKFHTHAVKDPAQKLQQARAVLQFVAEGMSVKGPLGDYMKEEAAHIALERHESVVYHDDLSESNRPFYFHEFAKMAAGYGLQFLAEADYSDMNMTGFPDGVGDRLEDLGRTSVVLQQQYRDFLRLRRFRQTLLVRREVPVNREAVLDAVPGLFAACETKPVATDFDLTPGEAVSFQVKSEATVSTNHPVMKAALAALGNRWPHPVAFADLLADTAALLERPVEEDDAYIVADTLATGLTGGVLHLFADPPPTAAVAGPTPHVSALARHQLTTGLPVVTNLLHIPVKIDNAVTRHLLTLMDGTRDRAAVIRDLAAWSAAEAVRTDAPEKPTIEELVGVYGGEIDAGFKTAAELALVTG